MPKRKYSSVPVAKGEEVEVEVSDLAYGGEGIARYNNFTIFVPFGIPGDKIIVRIEEVKKNYARGIIKKVIKDSKLFTMPVCLLFRKCGGCQWVNMRYEGQVQYKMSMLRHMLEKEGLKGLKINPPIIYKESFYYRDRAQYKLHHRKDKVEVGFYRAKSHEVIDVEHCYIVHKKIGAIANTIRDFLNSRRREVTIYNENTGRGYLRHIAIRLNKKEECLVTFVVARDEIKPYMDQMATDLVRRIDNIRGVTVNINTARGNRVFGEKEKILYGENYVIERVRGIDFMLGATTFFRVNTGMLEHMLDFVKKHLKHGVLADLYGGVGALSLPFYNKLKKTVIVEINTESAEMLEMMIRGNRIKKVEVVYGAAEEKADDIFSEIKPDTVLLDPPRKGVNPKILAGIIKHNIKNILYISCNPATFARDIKVLGDKYTVKEITPLDLFPHTYHIEVLSKLELR